jgi:hypothetical protein
VSIFHRTEPGSQPYFWRTSQGHEIDLIVDLGTEKIPFEIKLHSAPIAHDAEMLRQCMQQLNLKRSYLIHSGRENYSLGKGVTALSAEQVLSRPQTLPR